MRQDTKMIWVYTDNAWVSHAASSGSLLYDAQNNFLQDSLSNDLYSVGEENG